MLTNRRDRFYVTFDPQDCHVKPLKKVGNSFIKNNIHQRKPRTAFWNNHRKKTTEFSQNRNQKVQPLIILCKHELYKGSPLTNVLTESVNHAETKFLDLSFLPALQLPHQLLSSTSHCRVWNLQCSFNLNPHCGFDLLLCSFFLWRTMMTQQSAKVMPGFSPL